MLAESNLLGFWHLRDICFIGSHGISSAFDRVIIFLDVASCLESFEFNLIFDWKRMKQSKMSAGGLRSHFLKLKSSMAAVFCTHSSFLMRFSGSPFIKLLLVNLACDKCMYNRARGFLAQEFVDFLYGMELIAGVLAGFCDLHIHFWVAVKIPPNFRTSGRFKFHFVLQTI